jgi:hypothetical protein
MQFTCLRMNDVWVKTDPRMRLCTHDTTDESLSILGTEGNGQGVDRLSSVSVVLCPRANFKKINPLFWQTVKLTLISPLRTADVSYTGRKSCESRKAAFLRRNSITFCRATLCYSHFLWKDLKDSWSWALISFNSLSMHIRRSIFPSFPICYHASCSHIYWKYSEACLRPARTPGKCTPDFFKTLPDLLIT